MTKYTKIKQSPRAERMSKRTALSSTAALLGLSGGAIGWAGLAEAAEDDRALQTLLLPDHYQILEGGTLVFALETGEQLVLNQGQYVMLEGGLVLVVDELAQNAMATLPVLGSLRTELLSEIEPVRSTDGSLVEATSSQPLWSGDGAAPRLLDQLAPQTYEIAQNTDSEDDNGFVLTSVPGLGLAAFGLGLGPSGLRFTSSDS